MTIVNDDSSIFSEQSFQLIDDARGVIYNRRMFIIQATGLESSANKDFQNDNDVTKTKNYFNIYNIFSEVLMRLGEDGIQPVKRYPLIKPENREYKGRHDTKHNNTQHNGIQRDNKKIRHSA